MLIPEQKDVTEVMKNRRIERHGLVIEWVNSTLVPGPGVTGGQCAGMATWFRIDGGDWWLPRHRGLLRTVDIILNVETAGDIRFTIQGRKQFE